MKRTRVSLPEQNEVGQKQSCPSRQQRQKLSTAKPRTIKRKVSVNKVNTRNNKEQTTEEKLTKKSAPITEVDLETPEQSTDEVERKTTDSIPVPKVEEQQTKTIEFSSLDNGNEITGNTQ